MYRFRGVFVIAIVVAAVLVLFLTPFFGVVPTPFSTLWANSNTSAQTAQSVDVFWNLRIPRVILGFLAGSGLAVSQKRTRCGLRSDSF